jgi:predicted ATPase
MWGDAADLAGHLQELGRLEFLFELRTGEETAYVFKHALTQEVAYESILAPQRRVLHAAAGHALEALHADRLEDVYDRLAYHFARTGETAKAVEYLTRFAEQAASRHQYVEGVAALEDDISRVHGLSPGCRIVSHAGVLRPGSHSADSGRASHSSQPTRSG